MPSNVAASTGRRVRVVVVGLGVQGRKRRAVAGDDVVATVDPVADADHRDLREVPLGSYDAALVCTPDGEKLGVLEHLLGHGKHVLVEKPLLGDDAELERLAALASASGAVCYTAYNHRFEPHLVRLQDVLRSGALGRLHRLRLFYGNGTAADVKGSPWRDRGAGVLPDLGSHLLDLLLFLLDEIPEGLAVWSARRFENAAWDHVVCGVDATPLVELEMSLVSWRNHFVAEVVGDRGSATVESLCKWGPTTFTQRTRVLPSGRPPEDVVVLEQADPTWDAEYAAFLEHCATRTGTNIANDIKIGRMLRRLAATAD